MMSARWLTRKPQPLLPHRETELTTIYRPEYLCEKMRYQLGDIAPRSLKNQGGILDKRVEKFVLLGMSIHAPLPMQHSTEQLG